MLEVKADTEDEAAKLKAAREFTKDDRECSFGLSFFFGPSWPLRARPRPGPNENLPTVQVRPADGESLDVCDIIGVSPRWVMFAVRDTANHRDEMAVEIVPYQMIRRVGIGSWRAEGASMGFAQTRPPEIILREGAIAQQLPVAI